MPMPVSSTVIGDRDVVLAGGLAVDAGRADGDQHTAAHR